MTTKIVSQLDDDGYFLCQTTADVSPLEPGVFVLPGGAVDAIPPSIPNGKRAKWTGLAFLVEDIPTPPPPPVQTLGEVKTLVWEQIKIQRDRRKSGGFKVKIGGVDKWFHSDLDSRIQHLGLKDKARDLLASGGLLAGKLTVLGQPVRWKTMDGSFVEISAQIAFDIVAAAGDLDAQLFTTAEQHRVVMEASANPEVYDYSTGWPLSYQPAPSK